MKAGLVYDGGSTVYLPPTMGEPLPDQMQGTAFDQLGEVCSRICYDSFGYDKDGKRKGRSSDKLHSHILDVDNTSVHEHQNFTVKFPRGIDSIAVLSDFANRKGTFVEYINGCFEVTSNLRAVLKWDRCSGTANGLTSLHRIQVPDGIKNTMRYWASLLAPKVVAPPEGDPIASATLKPLEELTENQAHITLWLYGSRGFSHEQVRHRFAISQRSTRYVDESESPYIVHPLIAKFLENGPFFSRNAASFLYRFASGVDRITYRYLVKHLQRYCVDSLGITDKTSARKQARGAARGNLGNALATEMLYTTSAANWRWILSQRKSKAADAEIREIYSPALAALQGSRFAHFFEEFDVGPSPDGIGTVLV